MSAQTQTQTPTPLTVETDSDGRFILNGHDVVWHSTYVHVVNQRATLLAQNEQLRWSLQQVLISVGHGDAKEIARIALATPQPQAGGDRRTA
jgi:hypothetical protein